MRRIDGEATKVAMIETIARMMVSKRWMRSDKDNEDEILAVIDNTPDIDAVPVVRCKDCIHAIKFKSGQVSCGYHDWCRVQVDPDGYCNHGEKDE